MNLLSLIDLQAGGPGSGCQGPNCGRPATGQAKEQQLQQVAKKNELDMNRHRSLIERLWHEETFGNFHRLQAWAKASKSPWEQAGKSTGGFVYKKKLGKGAGTVYMVVGEARMADFAHGRPTLQLQVYHKMKESDQTWTKPQLRTFEWEPRTKMAEDYLSKYWGLDDREWQKSSDVGRKGYLEANRKLHYKTAFQGLPISVENRKGSVRQGCDKEWGCWRTKMKIPYGYIRGTKGMDGDAVDVFIGPKVDAKFAYVITTKRQPDFKQDDEQKVMLGFGSASEAKKSFLAHFDDSRFFGRMQAIPMEQFKKRVLAKPGKVEAWGEPQVYDGGYQHMGDAQTPFHPPSLRKAKPVPTDDPREKDNRYLDVTKRKDKETLGLRNRLTKKHADANQKPLSSQMVGGFPAISIGGFG